MVDQPRLAGTHAVVAGRGEWDQPRAGRAAWVTKRSGVAQDMVRGGWRRVLVLVLAVGLVATGCVQQISGVGAYSSGLSNVPDANIPVQNTNNGPIDKLAGNAISDIQGFWTQQMPLVFNKHYQPVSAFYSIDPSGTVTAPCTNQPSDIRGNAFYCPSKDIVAWDRASLFPELDKTYGPFLVAMVLAHEWGHAIQHRTATPSERTIVVETQADCYAGSWVAYALKGHAPHFQISRDDLDQALAGYLQFRDPVGASQNDQQAHGSGFDRISAFQEGFEQGTKHCTAFNDNRTFTELGFQPGSQDYLNQGNMPYDEMLQTGPKDLAGYWAATFQKVYGKKWTPLAHLTPYTSGQNQPKCDGAAMTSLEYCAADDTIYYDDATLRKIYTHTGDFGPITLIGVAYGEAVRKRLNETVNGEDAVLGSICLAGSYADDVFPREQPRRADSIVLSPGDLDEALQALLNFAGRSGIFDAKGTDGFDRVTAFRRGFNNIKSCS